MDLLDAVENIQNENLDFVLEYYIEPKNKEEHFMFLNFCKDKDISLVSGKSFDTIPFNGEQVYNSTRFAFVKTKLRIGLTYETCYYFQNRKRIEVFDFIDLFKEKESIGA